MPDQIFGPLVSFFDIEDNLRAHLKDWLDTYLSARERKVALVPGTIARPRSWPIRQTFNVLPGEEQTPAVIIVSSGFPEKPHKHGDGHWEVEFEMAVVVLCHGTEADAARKLAGHYQAALLAICLHKPKFGTGTKLCDWNDFGVEDVEDSQVRTLCAARLEFGVKVNNFATSVGGPSMPNPPLEPHDPQPDRPYVFKIDVRVGERFFPPVTARAVIRVTGGKTS